MQAYQLMHEQCHYPLHLGVTEAGTTHMGTLKSAVGIGGLLALGIGDTLRVTPDGRPGGGDLRRPRYSEGHRPAERGAGAWWPAPPAGGRRSTSSPWPRQVEERLKTVTKPITVAVMGCPVNGPGEASAADVGIAGGNGKGLLFRHGKVIKQVPQEALLDELMALIEELP